jgi:dipeptidyl aminopeptidase/acylaminoacyl peptidase
MTTLPSLLLLIGFFAEAEPKPVVTVPAVKHKGDNAAAVAISADGALVAAAYGGPSTARFPLEGTTGGLWVWDRKTGKQLYSLKEFGSILRVEFSRDGRCLAYTRIYTPGDSIHTARTALIDWKAGKVVHHWEADCFAFDPTGDRILVGTSDRDAVRPMVCTCSTLRRKKQS